MSEQNGEEWNLRLQEGGARLRPSHLRQPPTWIEFMREIDVQWQHYMLEYDTPEGRLAPSSAPASLFPPEH